MVLIVKRPQAAMVYRPFSACGKVRLKILPKNVIIKTQRYMTILQNKLPPNVNIHHTSFFIQDNASCHTSKIMKKFFKNNQTDALDWPNLHFIGNL